MLTPQDLNDLRAPVHIISLGAGVQSSTMALMAARGLILPRPIGAIFADTQDEPASVYRWLDRARLPRNKTPCQTATYTFRPANDSRRTA